MWPPPAQAARMDRMLPLLTEEEAAIYRRGRNAHVHGVPKGATPQQYAKATGLECLFGALYLSGRWDRVNELFCLTMEEEAHAPLTLFFLSAAVAELRPQLLGARIDKIQMPVRDQVVFQFRGPGGAGRLLLSASPGSPRLHLTTAPLQNPAQPPMFCMLLRKHLSGGRITAVTQPPMERLVDLTLECTDEMGEKAEKHLIVEMMGRGRQPGPDQRRRPHPRLYAPHRL